MTKTKDLNPETKTHYITTAIVYPNANMHLGFAWETIASDWLARSRKLLGQDVYFVTGMDEHSVKVAKAAEVKNLSPKAYCDEMAEKTVATLKSLQVNYDRFIRTSDEDHERVVQHLVQKAFDSGDIYKAKYEGHYCEGCEAYYLEKDLVDGKCAHHLTLTPKWISEENYFFRLSKYEAALKKLFLDQPQFLVPEHRKAEVLNFIESGLTDFSISRSSFTWGVPLPFDSKHIVYVWFDALVNYVTAAKYLEGEEVFRKLWPANVHIIGKDITRFHCIYWPAMLMALDLPLPKQVFAHGFLSIRGDRMSKSSGNAIYPADVLAIASSDALRYYLLAENQFSQDGNFAFDLMAFKVNADLSNDLGNLVNRTINMSRKYFPEETLTLTTPESNHAREIQEKMIQFAGELLEAVEKIDTVEYAKACTARSRLLNLYIDQMKPWALAKLNTPESLKELREVIYVLLEGIRFIAAGLSSILPTGAEEIYRQLGLTIPSEMGRVKNLRWGESKFKVETPHPIFPRIELPVENAEAKV